MSHLEAVQGVVGHAHFSPLKVGDSGGPLPSAALGASELQLPPRPGRARAGGGGRLGLVGWAWAPGARGGGIGGVGNTWFPKRRNRGQASGRGCRVYSRCVCACVSACVRTRALRCVRSPGCSPRLGPLRSFTHPHLRFHFLCPELCSELLLPSFALGPSLPPPPASGLWAWLSSPFHLSGLRFLVARPFCLCPLPRPLHPSCALPSSMPFPLCWLVLDAVSLFLPRTLLLPLPDPQLRLSGQDESSAWVSRLPFSVLTPFPTHHFCPFLLCLLSLLLLDSTSMQISFCAPPPLLFTTTCFPFFSVLTVCFPFSSPGETLFLRSPILQATSHLLPPQSPLLGV